MYLKVGAGGPGAGGRGLGSTLLEPCKGCGAKNALLPGCPPWECIFSGGKRSSPLTSTRHSFFCMGLSK